MAQALSTVTEKWKQRASQSGAYYTAGVQGAGPKYDQGVAGGGPAWEQGVTSAISRGAWTKGASGKGSYYATRAAAIGAGRWSQGIGTGDAKYQQNFGPYYSAETSFDPGVKGARGSEANLARARNMAVMLHNMKMSK